MQHQLHIARIYASEDPAIIAWRAQHIDQVINEAVELSVDLQLPIMAYRIHTYDWTIGSPSLEVLVNGPAQTAFVLRNERYEENSGGRTAFETIADESLEGLTYYFSEYGSHADPIEQACEVPVERVIAVMTDFADDPDHRSASVQWRQHDRKRMLHRLEPTPTIDNSPERLDRIRSELESLRS